MSKLNENKSTGPNSLYTKIIKLLKNDIFSQLADIFNISFSSGISSSHLKLLNKPNPQRWYDLTIERYPYYQTLARF